MALSIAQGMTRDGAVVFSLVSKSVIPRGAGFQAEGGISREPFVALRARSLAPLVKARVFGMTPFEINLQRYHEERGVAEITEIPVKSGFALQDLKLSGAVHGTTM